MHRQEEEHHCRKHNLHYKVKASYEEDPNSPVGYGSLVSWEGQCPRCTEEDYSKAKKEHHSKVVRMTLFFGLLGGIVGSPIGCVIILATSSVGFGSAWVGGALLAAAICALLAGAISYGSGTPTLNYNTRFSYRRNAPIR